MFFLTFNYLYLGTADFINNRSVYQGLTKSSAQIMVNFSITVFFILLINQIINQQTIVVLSEVSDVSLLSIGIGYCVISVITNFIFIAKNWL